MTAHDDGTTVDYPYRSYYGCTAYEGGSMCHIIPAAPVEPTGTPLRDYRGWAVCKAHDNPVGRASAIAGRDHALPDPAPVPDDPNCVAGLS